MAKAIRVLLVDDHEFAREGLRRMLEPHPEIEVVGEASGAREALSLVDSLAPDVVLMDIKMPDMNGLEATRLLKEKAKCEVVILSLYDEYLAQAMEAGAGGYLTKDVKRTELASAVLRVHSGELVLGTNLLSNPKAAETALKHLREAVKGRQTPDPNPEARVPHKETTAPLTNDPNPGASLETGQEQTSPIPPSGPQAPLPAGTSGGQDPSSQSQPPVEPTADGPPSWAPAPWAVPLPEVQPPAPLRLGSELPTTAATRTPPAAADFDDTDEDNPFSQSAKSAAMTEMELVLPPPLSAARMMRFCHRLEETTSAKIVSAGGSWQEGAVLTIAFHKSVSLLEAVQLMPEVAQVSEEEESPPKSRSLNPFKGRGKGPSLPEGSKRLRLVLKEATDPTQLTFRL